MHYFNIRKLIIQTCIIAIALLSCCPIFCQINLDQTWGTNGTIEVTTDSILYAFTEMQFDKEGNIYVSGYYTPSQGNTSIHNVNQYPFVHKLTPGGEMDEDFGIAGNLYNTESVKVGPISHTGTYLTRDGYTLFHYNDKVVIMDPELNAITEFGLQSVVLDNTVYDFHVDEVAGELSLLTWGASYSYDNFTDPEKTERNRVDLKDLLVDEVEYGSYPGYARTAKFADNKGNTFMIAENKQDASTNAIIVTTGNGSISAHSPKDYAIGGDTIVCGGFVHLNDSEVLVLGSERSTDHGRLLGELVLMKFNEQGFDTAFATEGLIKLSLFPDVMNGPIGLIPLSNGYYLVLSGFLNRTLSVLNESGELQTELGENGFIGLDFLPGNYVFSCQLAGDADGNVYLMSREDETTLHQDAQQYYISKLDIEGLLATLAEQERIKQVGTESTFMLTPNPDLGKISLSYKGLDLHDLKITVYDEVGQLVGSYAKSTFTDNEVYSLDKVLYSSGVYLIKVTDTNGSLFFSERAIVLKT